MQEQSFQKRQVAYKVKVSDVLSGDFLKDQTSAGYVNFNGLKLSRVNVMGILVDKQEGASYSSAIIDDGSGKLMVRSFEKSEMFSKVGIGDAVIAIARIREFNNERYLVLEIIKKLADARWLNVRKIETRFTLRGDGQPAGEPAAEKPQDILGIYEHAFSLIREHDKGSGADVDDVIKRMNSPDAESAINRLLENGDIFEIKPGKLKVLE